MELLKLYPEQISNHWPLIRESIIGCNPPQVEMSEESMTHILEGLFSGAITCWAAMRNEKCIGILTTVITTEIASRSKSLLLFSAYAFEELKPEDYADGFNTMFKFGKANGCTEINFFTENPKLLDIVKPIGNVSTRLYASINLG